MRVFVLNGWAASVRAWSLCSFRREGVFSYVEQLDGLAERALAQCDGKALLVGWSMGGSFALKLAAEHPDKVAGLVLVAATPRMMEDKASGWKGMGERRLAAFEYAAKSLGGEGLFGPPSGKPNPYEKDTDENLARGLKYLEETDLRDAVAAFAAANPGLPVAIFQSEKDGIVRPGNALWLKSVFPQAVLEMVDGAEHALPITIPEKIDAAVAAMLGR